MSTSCLIYGESGTGKSTSIRTMDPKETFLIRVIDKPLPFRKAKEVYASGPSGNMLVTDDAKKILAMIQRISDNGDHIKTIVIDDFQYVMANEFMRRANEVGYTKFTEIGLNAWNIFMCANKLRSDLVIIFLSHCEVTDAGITKFKTIGRMLDEKITVEGLFTIVLQSVVRDGEYKFMTKNNGHNTVKSPMEMFDGDLIENDLNHVSQRIRSY
jgi:hypothetical protein